MMTTVSTEVADRSSREMKSQGAVAVARLTSMTVRAWRRAHSGVCRSGRPACQRGIRNSARPSSRWAAIQARIQARGEAMYIAAPSAAPRPKCTTIEAS